MFIVEYSYYNYPKKTKEFKTYESAKKFFFYIGKRNGVKKVELTQWYVKNNLKRIGGSVMTELMKAFNRLVNSPEYWERGELLDGSIRDTLAIMFPMIDDADLEHELNVMIDDYFGHFCVLERWYENY